MGGRDVDTQTQRQRERHGAGKGSKKHYIPFKVMALVTHDPFFPKQFYLGCTLSQMMSQMSEHQ